MTFTPLFDELILGIDRPVTESKNDFKASPLTALCVPYRPCSASGFLFSVAEEDEEFILYKVLE